MEWISVKDRLPTDFEWCMVYTSGGYNAASFFDGTWSPLDADDAGFVTHWMPLPEPPKD